MGRTFTANDLPVNLHQVTFLALAILYADLGGLHDSLACENNEARSYGLYAVSLPT
jgi:hypothetical protein